MIASGNPAVLTLAEADAELQRAGYIEAWGQGIEKINRECREHGIEPPEYDCSLGGLMVTFHANPAHIREAGSYQGSATTPETTPEKIMALLRAEPTMTRHELARRIGITLDGIRYHLKKLKSAGRIRHVGPTKAGSWEVLR